MRPKAIDRVPGAAPGGLLLKDLIKIMKKRQEYKITYHYVKPKNEAETKERVFKINEAYDLLFNTMLEEGIIKFVGDKAVFSGQKPK